MTYIDCIPVNSFDLDSIASKKPKICNASIKFILINEPQKILNTLVREDHFNGVGIIELEVEYSEYPKETIRLIFSEVRGMELDTENELDYLLSYGKEFLLEDLQPKLSCTVLISEPSNHFVALVSNGDQWFVSI